ncbi:MAG: sialidase family protein [Anaerolineae bacterium]
MASVPTLYETIINPTGPGNPRNGEGDIIALRDGRLLMAWSRFSGPDDHSQAEIWARHSDDGGLSWGEPFVLQENVGQCNVMSVSFLRLRSGDLLFGFAIKNHESQDCHMFVRRSADDGRTWSAAILATPEEGYIGANNNRLVQTRTGRVLYPCFRCIDEHYHSQAAVFASDDDGRTWRRLSEWLDLPGPVGASEPGVVQCADGSLWLWMRTDKQRIYACRSRDDGATWTAPAATGLIAPISPASAVRLPTGDALLMIYNDRRTAPPVAGDVPWRSEFNRRTPLVAAISRDHGETWQDFQYVEADESKSYCYTSITFHRDTTLLTYYVGVPDGPNLIDMKLKIVPTAAWTRL